MKKITLTFTPQELQVIDTALFDYKVALKTSTEISMSEARDQIDLIEGKLLPMLEDYVQ